MIGRVRDRATFASFRARGVRAGSGPLSLVFVAEDGGTGSSRSGAPVARVAFAIPRRVGHAVQRNRLRRQLRSILAELPADRLPVGAYLVAVRPEATGLRFAELRDHVLRALSDITRRTSRAPATRTRGRRGDAQPAAARPWHSRSPGGEGGR